MQNLSQKNWGKCFLDFFIVFKASLVQTTHRRAIMNQRGEITLTTCLINLAIFSIFILCTYELKKSFSLLEKRTLLFLCVKEAKGELTSHLKLMGRTNWAIKNVNRAKMVMYFIPGLQGAALNAQKAKKYLQHYQEISTVSYLKKFKSISQKGCPLDPRISITPYQLGTSLLVRDKEGAAILREKKWSYYYLLRPYLLDMKIDATKSESARPQVVFYTQERKGKQFSPFLSH